MSCEPLAAYRAVGAAIRLLADDPCRIAKAQRIHRDHGGVCVSDGAQWPCLTRELADEALAALIPEQRSEPAECG